MIETPRNSPVSLSPDMTMPVGVVVGVVMSNPVV
jgi:hypothetical protein